MDALDILDDIKENIGGSLTDEDLREWASLLTEAIYESDNIEQAAGDTVNTLIQECKQANFRAGRGYSEIHNKILLGRYYNLLRFVIDSLNIENREEVFEHCWNVINGTNEQSQPETRPNEAQQRAEREKLYFDAAIKGGLMQETETGYKWIYQNGNKASLAYFLMKIYNPNGLGKTPYKEMETLFSVTRLDRATQQLLEAKNTQKWREKIDELFQD